MSYPVRTRYSEHDRQRFEAQARQEWAADPTLAFRFSNLRRYIERRTQELEGNVHELPTSELDPERR
jgi:hypothetical protein